MSHSLKLSCAGKSIVTNSRTYVGFHVAAAVSPMCPHVTHATRTLWPLRFFTVLPLLNLLCLFVGFQSLGYSAVLPTDCIFNYRNSFVYPSPQLATAIR